ncbi:MAG TPA: YetF domain-containing protein [Croceibacterium sp.]|nr:YetF domain-containing protein [Croceibacterium sp.]
MDEVFGLTMPLWEIALRATLVYLVLIVLLRAIPKRNAGHISPNDMLTLILVGTLGADAITGDSTSIGDMALMIGLVLGWSYLLDFAEYHVPWLRGWLRDKPAPLIKDGRMVRANMRKEMVTEEELHAVLRKEGVDDIAAVRFACIEADGDISLSLKSEATASGGNPGRTPGNRSSPIEKR